MDFIMSRKKIALIGAGNIGGTIAHLITQKNLGDVVLVDIDPDMPAGKALDIQQGCAVYGHNTSITGGSSDELLKDSDVVIVTAGIPRKPGMSRDDLLETNAKIIKSVGERIGKHCPNAFVIVITNPLDVMVWVMKESSGLPSSHVVGMAGVLDTSRYKTFLAKALGVSVSDIQGFVLGGHGDSMVPLPRYTTICGIPLSEFIENGWISQDDVNAIIDRTRSGGGEIVGLLKNGSAFYAPAESAVSMAESYLFDQKRLLPCAAYLSGEYGIKDCYMGVPSVIGQNGIEKIVDLKLMDDEKNLLNKSHESVIGLMEDVKKMGVL
jgi:malate dehydrogenase